jgi:hypothetical protein
VEIIAVLKQVQAARKAEDAPGDSRLRTAPGTTMPAPLGELTIQMSQYDVCGIWGVGLSESDGSARCVHSSGAEAGEPITHFNCG